MKFIKEFPLIAFFVLLMFFLMVGRVSNSVGFCTTQMRFISDDELIEMYLYSAYKNTIKLTPSDTSVKAYIKNHPSCCKIETTFILDLLDMSARKLYINYPIRPEAIVDRGGAEFEEKYFSISACGEQLESKAKSMGSDSID